MLNLAGVPGKSVIFLKIGYISYRVPVEVQTSAIIMRCQVFDRLPVCEARTFDNAQTIL
jgi:hypothetical protein